MVSNKVQKDARADHLKRRKVYKQIPWDERAKMLTALLDSMHPEYDQVRIRVVCFTNPVIHCVNDQEKWNVVRQALHRVPQTHLRPMVNHLTLTARHRPKRGERRKRSREGGYLPVRERVFDRVLPPPLAKGGHYSLIYVDPPWEFSLAIGEGAAKDIYDTMSMAELCALPVKQLGADDSAILMWTTSALMENAFDLMRAW